MMTASQIVSSAKDLPSLPVVVAKLASLLRDEGASSADFEKVVRPDPALTANLLRVANSPYFGARRQITSVRQAITYLGVERVFELAAGSAFRKVLPSRIPGYDVESTAFFAHCIAVATLAERLATASHLKLPDMTFTAGLLHDIGKLAIGTFLLERAPLLVEALADQKLTFVDAERSLIGTDHNEVGTLVAEKWDLPLAVHRVVRWHHAPDEVATDPDSALIDLVHIADAMAHSMGFGADVGGLARRISDGALQRLHLKVRQLETVAGETLAEITDVAGAFVEQGQQGGEK